MSHQATAFQTMRPSPNQVKNFDVNAYTLPELMEMVGLNPWYPDVSTEHTRVVMRQIILQFHPDRAPAGSPLKSGKHFEFYRACVDRISLALANGPTKRQQPQDSFSFSSPSASPSPSPTVAPFASSPGVFEAFLKAARTQEMRNPVYRYDDGAAAATATTTSAALTNKREDGRELKPPSTASGKKMSAAEINARFESLQGPARVNAFQRLSTFQSSGIMPRTEKQVHGSFDRALQAIYAQDEEEDENSYGRAPSSSSIWKPKTQVLPGVFDTAGLTSASLFDPSGRSDRRRSSEVNVFASPQSGNHIDQVHDARVALAASAKAAVAKTRTSSLVTNVEAFQKARESELNDFFGSKEAHQSILDQMQNRRNDEYERNVRAMYLGGVK